jgi:SulP family sulfate permease
LAAVCAAALSSRVGAGRRGRLQRRAGSAATGSSEKSGLKLISPLAFQQWTDWPTEIGAGVTTAVVALPLAMAFGVASGAGPMAGLYGAIFTGFFAAFLGGTPAQVTGPTGPMTVILASVIAKYNNPAIAFSCVFIAGLIQIAMGVLKLGGAIRLVPVTVLSGFMTGIGGIICSLQLPVMFGYSGGGAVTKALMVLPKALMAPNLPALSIGLLTLGILYKLPDKFTFKIPKPLIALLTATAVSAGIFPSMGIVLPTLPSIPMGFPKLMMPSITASMLPSMMFTSLALALLGAIDSLLTSLVSDSMTSSFHDSNRELFGQGIGNAIAGLFGGAAGAGATMRTVVNVKTGGRTPISGATHSVVLLFVVAALGPLASNIPTACLAGILIKSGLDVVDWNLLKRIDKIPITETIIMLVTFFLTVFVDLILAVVVGWLLGICLFFYRSTELQLSPEGVEIFEDPSSATGYWKEWLEKHSDACVIKLSGVVTFGVAVSLMRKLVPIVVGKKKVMVDLSAVTMIDASAVLSLEELVQKIKAAGGESYVCGAQSHMDGFETLTGLNLAEEAHNNAVTDNPRSFVA